MEEQNNQQNTQAPQSQPQGQTNVMALISYIGILCLIPIFAKPQDEFVKFHAKQGLVIFGGEVITAILSGAIPLLVAIWMLLNLYWVVLSILGIINVVKNEKKNLPFVGQFANKINI
jgi:fumarate reductase subunit D